MRIYIASSWRNAAGVEMLTSALRAEGYTVDSWIENNFGEKHNHVTKEMPFDQWVESDGGAQSFNFDTTGAIMCDVFIYYGPGGSDAAAELGAAWASQIKIDVPGWQRTIFGLWAKDEPIGLMRRMVHSWYDRPVELINHVKYIAYKYSNNND